MVADFKDCRESFCALGDPVMRGIGQTLSRLPAFRLMLAGAALLAGARSPVAHAAGKGGNDQTAMVIPRLSGPGLFPGSGGGYAALPQPLSPADAALARRIFADQATGRMADAARLTARLHDRTLLGPILAQRDLGRFHRSTIAELTTWLTRYGWQPDAPAIRALLLRRLPAGGLVPSGLRAALAVAAPARLEPLAARPETPAATADPAADNTDAPPWLRGLMLTDGARDAVSLGLNRIAAARDLRPEAAAVLRATLARALFAANHDHQALRVAEDAARLAGPRFAGPPAYIAGLAAWRLGRTRRAALNFAAAARGTGASASLRTAAAYWAGRAAQAQGRLAASASWFRRAARDGESFYGQIARDALGWGRAGRAGAGHAVLVPADLDALSALPAGRLAFALLQVGQTAAAAEALRVLWPALGADPQLRQAAMLVAARAGLRDVAAEMRAHLLRDRGVRPQALGFPMPVLRPRGGFRIDPALVYGMTRAESNFDSAAVSRAGARGLMQITPWTARAVTGDPHLTLASLHDPGFNLEVGQQVVRRLAVRQPHPGDLIGMLASYNAGLNNFRQWQGQVRANGDPLLFIEAIPVRQTRIFVERALAYTWLFAARLDEPVPSLDAIAESRFPTLSNPAPLSISLH